MPSHCMHIRNTMILFATVTTLLLSSCAEQSPSQAKAAKPVKTEVFGSTVQHKNSSFIGTLRARQRTDLSFDSAGRVVAIPVDVGDRVKAGQVLAQLDESPARLRLDRVQAEHNANSSILAERTANLRQQELLAKDGVISPSALRTVRNARQEAVSQMKASEAALASARRDLNLTRITAPFDGEVVARLVQPFVDVASGQAILQIEAGKEFEVVIMLPDTVAATLASGMYAQAIVGGEQLELELERLSGRSDNGSLVQVVFQVRNPPTGVRSGAVVSVDLPHGTTQSATLPLSAVMADTEASQGSVFVLDPATSTLKRRTVEVGDTPHVHGRVTILAGLEAGEQVVVAGTAYLI